VLHSGTAPRAGYLDKIRPRCKHRPQKTYVPCGATQDLGKQAKTNELILGSTNEFSYVLLGLQQPAHIAFMKGFILMDGFWMRSGMDFHMGASTQQPPPRGTMSRGGG